MTHRALRENMEPSDIAIYGTIIFTARYSVILTTVVFLTAFKHTGRAENSKDSDKHISLTLNLFVMKNPQVYDLNSFTLAKERFMYHIFSPTLNLSLTCESRPKKKKKDPTTIYPSS